MMQFHEDASWSATTGTWFDEAVGEDEDEVYDAAGDHGLDETGQEELGRTIEMQIFPRRIDPDSDRPNEQPNVHMHGEITNEEDDADGRV